MIFSYLLQAFMPLYLGGSSAPNTSTKFEPPDYAKGPWADYVNGMVGLTQQPYNQYQGTQVAPLNADQYAGMDMARQRAMNGAPDLNAARGMVTDTANGMYLGSNPALQGYTQAMGQGQGIGADPYASMMQFMGNGGGVGQNPFTNQSSQVGHMAQGDFLHADQFGQGGTNRAVSQGQFLGADPFVGHDNPWLSNNYTNQVIGDTAGNMTNAYREGPAAYNDAMAARAGAFGGSAHDQQSQAGAYGLSNSIGQMANQYQLARTGMGVQDFQAGNALGSQSWNQGMNQMQNANALGSQSNNQAYQNMLNAGQIGGQGHTNDINQMLGFGAQGQGSRNQQSGQALQAAGMGAQDWQAERGNMMQGAGLAGQLSQDDWRSIQALTGVGDAQRQYTQDLLNQQLGMFNQQQMYPYQQADWLRQALTAASGGATMGQSTQSNMYQASPIANLLGGAAALYGGYQMMK